MSHYTRPVTILTGFLGAGKTTLLNHWLSGNPDRRYVIIENEYGAQGIDNELILRPDETIVELNSGCLCCTLNDNLYELLNDLHDRREEFDEIIIEATGVADPTGLAQPFLSHPLIKKHFPLRAIVCLVDAEQVERQLEETEEAIKQIAFSDILLLNKLDLIDDDRATSLVAMLGRLNPVATLYTGHRGAFPEVDLSNSEERLEQLYREERQHFMAAEAPADFPVPRPHGHHHHHHTDSVVSHTFYLDRPFVMATLRQQLLVYLTFQARGLYRIKGLIWLEGEEEQYLLQSVGNRFDLTPKRPWQPKETRQSTLVFIGKDLRRGGLEKLLERCLVRVKV